MILSVPHASCEWRGGEGGRKVRREKGRKGGMEGGREGGREGGEEMLERTEIRMFIYCKRKC